MASTGEVACLGYDLEDAFLKSLISAGFKLPKKNVLISISGDESRYDLLDEIMMLKKMGFNIFATDSTHRFLEEQGIKSTVLHKVREKKTPNISDYLSDQKLDLAIVISEEISEVELKDEYLIRRKAIDFSIPLITNTQLAKLLMTSIAKRKLKELEIRPWDHYVKD